MCVAKGVWYTILLDFNQHSHPTVCTRHAGTSIITMTSPFFQLFQEHLQQYFFGFYLMESASMVGMFFRLINLSWAPRLSATQCRHKTSRQTFLTSVATWYIIEKELGSWKFYATSWNILRAIIFIISFCIVLCTYLLLFFLVLQVLSPFLYSHCRIYNWVKTKSFPLPLPWRGRACLAKNLTFERIFSRFCWFTCLSLSKTVDN